MDRIRKIHRIDRIDKIDRNIDRNRMESEYR